MRIVIGLFCICTFFSCQSSQDKDFQELFKGFQSEMDKEPLLRAFLEQNFFLDSTLISPKKKDVERVLSFSKKQLNQLHHIEQKRLDVQLHEHYDNIHSFLNIIIENIEAKKIHQTNPALYSAMPVLKYLEKQPNMEIWKSSLDQLPMYFQTAINNLEAPNVEQLDAVISEAIAAYEFSEDKLSSQVKSLKLGKEEEKTIQSQLKAVKLGLKDYIAFCNSKLFEMKN